MNEDMLVTHGTDDTISIDFNVFRELLDLTHIKKYKAYKSAEATRTLDFKNLKKLSAKAKIPYPLFFASQSIAKKHILDNFESLNNKFPTKNEMRVSLRGRCTIKDVELIVKDLARRQEFLKKINDDSVPNSFMGKYAKDFKSKTTTTDLAERIAKSINFRLDEYRLGPKSKALRYLTRVAEKNNILVAFSSQHFMPQNISRHIGLSGLCVKDKCYPVVFIYTGEDDENFQVIVEPVGRQIFTLMTMITCVAINKFVLSTKSSGLKNGSDHRAYTIAGEILVPNVDIECLTISNIDELSRASESFRVTPSMLLVRLKERGRVTGELFNTLWDTLKKVSVEKGNKYGNKITPARGYEKYNGEKYSRDVLLAYKNKKISKRDLNRALFKKGKIESSLYADYVNRFK